MKKILFISLFFICFFALGFWASRIYLNQQKSTPETNSSAMQTYLGAHHTTDSEPHNFWGSYRGDFELGDQLITAKNIAIPPRGLAVDFPPSNFHFYTVDIDQDGTEDFIVESKTEWQTCFIKSDLSIKNCEKLNHFKSDGFAYEYFVSRGKNKTLLLFDFSGSEDSSNYSLQTFNASNWKLEKLLNVFPLVDSTEGERSGIYWGYPWDIRNIEIKFDKGSLQFLSSLDHSLKDISEESINGPAILFIGSASQGDAKGMYEKLRSKLKFQSIDKLK